MRLVLAEPGRPNDLVLASSFSMICGVVSLVAPQTPGLWLLALIAIFILPGYCVLSAISPGKGFLDKQNMPSTISRLERFMVSIMLSIFFIAISSMLLSWSDWGLTTTSAVLEVSGISVLGSLIAQVRRSRLPAAEQFAASIEIRNPFKGLNMLERGIAMLVVIILVASTTVALTANRNMTESYSQLTITGASGTLSDLPQTGLVNQNITVRVTILNSMNHDLVYNLTVGVNLTEDQIFVQFQALDWTSNETFVPGVGFVSNISIASGQYYVANLVFRIPSPGTVKLFFLLTSEQVDLKTWLFLSVT